MYVKYKAKEKLIWVEAEAEMKRKWK